MLPQVARRGRNRSESRLNTRGHTSQVRMNATARLWIFLTRLSCVYCGTLSVRGGVSARWIVISTGLIDGIQQFFRASLDSTDSSAPYNFHCNSDHWQHDPCVGRPLVWSRVSFPKPETRPFVARTSVLRSWWKVALLAFIVLQICAFHW